MKHKIYMALTPSVCKALFVSLLTLISNFCCAQTPETFLDGDIIFQTSLSSQSKAIQIATGSIYSHMGLVRKLKGEYYVYEAIQPVKLTRLNEWIARGKNSYYVVKRLKDRKEIFTTENILDTRNCNNKFMGKNYDLYFEWSDDNIYCSELVWKVYKECLGVEIGQVQKLRDFNLADPVVKALLSKRYKNNIPLDEKVISPISIFNSDKLLMVVDTYLR